MIKRSISVLLCLILFISGSSISLADNGQPIADYKSKETIFFGEYEQDNDLENGKEPIEWIVLDVQGGKSLLISRYVLDCQPYNKIWTYITWETCTIRNWLNDTFLNNAFSAEEQEAIITTDVDNSSSQGHSKWRTNGGNDTKDKIFFLSYVEAGKYFHSDNARSCELTAYAATQIGDNYGWWLRSPGSEQSDATRVPSNGIYENITTIVYYTVGVRPAMWVNLDALSELVDIGEELDGQHADSLLIWGQEYSCGELSYSFVQEDALSYYSLRGKDANAVVTAVNTNAIPNTERINAKIQEVMEASNYEPTAGEIEGVQTEVYGSEDSDAFIMATYGDWGVNLMLFVDGAAGIADYFSGTIKTEDELQEPPASNSILGSAMQSAAEDSGTVKQFNLSAKEYIDAFNKRYATFGMTLEADQKRDDCWFIINGENTDIRIQFCDKVNGPWTTGSGLDMEKWNWLYAYIDTDDYECDIKYFASWPMFCSFLASIVDCEFTQEEFMENCKASGPDEFPVLTYLKDGIKNQIQFRDASVGNYHQTVYSASVEIIQ